MIHNTINSYRTRLNKTQNPKKLTQPRRCNSIFHQPVLSYLRTRTHLSKSNHAIDMENRILPKVFPYESYCCCLECQFLNQPNPEESIFLCLRTLETIEHEIDIEIDCEGYEEISSFWEPIYLDNLQTYV